jgi:hypothetical protein
MLAMLLHGIGNISAMYDFRCLMAPFGSVALGCLAVYLRSFVWLQ